MLSHLAVGRKAAFFASAHIDTSSQFDIHAAEQGVVPLLLLAPGAARGFYFPRKNWPPAPKQV